MRLSKEIQDDRRSKSSTALERHGSARVVKENQYVNEKQAQSQRMCEQRENQDMEWRTSCTKVVRIGQNYRKQRMLRILSQRGSMERWRALRGIVLASRFGREVCRKPSNCNKSGFVIQTWRQGETGLGDAAQPPCRQPHARMGEGQGRACLRAGVLGEIWRASQKRLTINLAVIMTRLAPREG